MDIFENIILCKDCNKKMNRLTIYKEGFKIRAMECPECKKKIYHPSDINEYNEFKRLKKKVFRVKLRIVGNSYAISIPKEIISFHEEIKKEIRNIVNLCLKEPGELRIFFENKKNINKVKDRRF